MPVQASGGYALITAIPKQDPSNPAVGQTIDRLRAALPPGSLIGGAVAENHDLQNALSAKTPLVLGVVLGLGFLLLLIALPALLLAAVGALTNLLATGAAFGVAKLVFQNGDLHALLGFQPQGFLDAWGPVFFFAMIFAISMDYTVFLLSSAKEHWDRTHDPKEAMIGGLAHPGRVIFAAGAVMLAVFLTFALSGPLPPKEMGIILGVAVLLDAALVRLLLLPVLLRLMAHGPGTSHAGHAARSPRSPSDTHKRPAPTNDVHSGPGAVRARPGLAARRRARLSRERSRHPEVREEAALAEPGDGRDALAGEREDDESVGTSDRRLGVGEVAAEGGLAIGPREHQPEVRAAAGRAVVQEGGDRVRALVLVRRGRHGEPRVVGEQGDNAACVTALDRSRKQADKLALVR
jgi:hypothetical protein